MQSEKNDCYHLSEMMINKEKILQVISNRDHEALILVMTVSFGGSVFM